MEPVEVPSVEVMQQQLDFELRVLRGLPGATSVTDFPPGGVLETKSDPQSNGVRLKLDGRLIKQTFNADIDNKVTAARVLLNKVKSTVGEAAVNAAVEAAQTGGVVQPPLAPAALTEAEEQWLADWYDSQPAPDEVSLQDANAALAGHRASVGGASTTQALMEAQWLRAKLRSAELRFEKAAADVARFKNAIAERQEEKRPRTSAPANDKERPPNWEKYKDYTQSVYQKLESEERACMGLKPASSLYLLPCTVACILPRTAQRMVVSRLCREQPSQADRSLENYTPTTW